ncbi:MAG: glucosyltransferase domain-containing protein [Lachnospiraceae bacterium]|nr:glucosyltransferase domain-containing protein [Lachnospiraceae bacterium]
MAGQKKKKMYVKEKLRKNGCFFISGCALVILNALTIPRLLAGLIAAAFLLLLTLRLKDTKEYARAHSSVASAVLSVFLLWLSGRYFFVNMINSSKLSALADKIKIPIRGTVLIVAVVCAACSFYFVNLVLCALLPKRVRICTLTELMEKLPDLRKAASRKWEENKKTFLFCMLVTFAWGLAAHAYMFFNNSVSHDSLVEFNAAVHGTDLKIQSGRVFVPVYRAISRGVLTLPWMIGLFSLLFIGLALFLTVKLFALKSAWMIALTAGILTTNITVTATTATYIHDLDSNMLSLLLAVCAVYLWKRFDRGFLYGIIPVCLSLGLYQSFVSVTITLILITLIMELLNYEKVQNILKKGIKSIGMLFGGGLLYFISIRIGCRIAGYSLSTGKVNSLDTSLSTPFRELLGCAVKGYVAALRTFVSETSLFSDDFTFMLHVLLLAIALMAVIFGLSQREIHIPEKLLTVLLILLMPMGMNVCYILTDGYVHLLMYYSVWLIHLFILLIVRWLMESPSLGERGRAQECFWETGSPEAEAPSGDGGWLEMSGKAQEAAKDSETANDREAANAWEAAKNRAVVKKGAALVLTAMVCVVLLGNVRTSNAAYLKKDIEYDANLSFFTRVVSKMEEVDGYVTGETEVVFVGKPNSLFESMSGFGHIYRLTGSGSTFFSPSASHDYFQAYFDYVLLNPAVMADLDTWNEVRQSKEVRAMPSYPDEGSIAMMDGVLVVKLG